MDPTIARIAAYARSLEFEHLDDVAIHEAKRRLIDTLGCALGGYDAEPCRIARKIAQRASCNPGSRLLGSQHRTLPELAAFANGVMARYLDGNDTYPGGGGHPSDTIASALSIADTTGQAANRCLPPSCFLTKYITPSLPRR